MSLPAVNKVDYSAYATGYLDGVGCVDGEMAGRRAECSMCILPPCNTQLDGCIEHAPLVIGVNDDDWWL